MIWLDLKEKQHVFDISFKKLLFVCSVLHVSHWGPASGTILWAWHRPLWVNQLDKWYLAQVYKNKYYQFWPSVSRFELMLYKV